ncbi:MAG: hypothetical protein HYZ57_19165, partial [Acidobacteria bacterium]|nr:hypothetical protein [Acidobacteriota bacterium]
EMGRLVRRDGALFVSVPDAHTFMDRLYRWLFHGGGHVNLFASAHELEQMLACYSGLPHVATKTLHSSFLYLNRRNLKPPLPRRVRLLSWQWETPVALLAWAARALDRRCRARASVYGWAFYFGNVPEPVAPGGWSNVCIRCGQAHASAWLEELGAVKRTPWLLKGYHCPNCGAANFFTRDDAKANPLDGS